LEDTIPSDRRRLPGLIPGFTGKNQLYSLPDRVVADGVYRQVYSAGGGIAE
jgi:hypothetical protein